MGMTVNRRQFCLSALTSACVPYFAANAEPADTTLAEIAKGKGLFYGSTVADAGRGPDTSLREHIISESSIVVAENDLKWQLISPAPGVYNFSAMDNVVAMAEQYKLLLRAHPLVWHATLPTWISGIGSRSEAEHALRYHINTLMGRYRGKFALVDVVNEAIVVTPKGEAEYAYNVWFRNLGVEYVWLAFNEARQTDPHALLALNEYGLEYDNAHDNTKREKVITSIKRLKDGGIPLDVLGIQGHLAPGIDELNLKAIEHLLGEMEKMDVKVYVSELDCNDRNLSGSEQSRDEATAKHAKKFLDVVLASPAAIGVMTWGLSDRMSSGNAQNRADKSKPRMLPLDRELHKKPLYYAIMDAFRAAPSRNLDARLQKTF
jgi:endo-1,4-beta-xylanase